MSQQFCRLFGNVTKTGVLSALKILNYDLQLYGNNFRVSRSFNFNQPSGIVLNQRSLSTSVKEGNTSLTEKARLEKEKQKKSEPKKVVLISDTKSIEVLTLEEAGRIAKKKGLNLIEVENTSEGLKTDKQVYKLVSNAQFYGEDWKSYKGGDAKSKETKEIKDKEKEEKTILLKSKTSEHDVLVKVKSIKKLVEKGHVVRVIIGQAGVQGQNPEIVYKIIEDQLKDEPVRIIQKVTKSSQIRFQVMPPKKEKLSNAEEKKPKKRPPKSSNEDTETDAKDKEAAA